jgi:hypothetical protein
MSWICVAGTKLDAIRPWARRSAIHVASFTSVFRPGTFLMCIAFASTSTNDSSSTCHTGFPYTPVASIATCVTRPSASQSASARSCLVVVPNVATACSAFGPSWMRRHATTTSLCTSSPAHRGFMTSICSSLRYRRGTHVVKV